MAHIFHSQHKYDKRDGHKRRSVDSSMWSSTIESDQVRSGQVGLDQIAQSVNQRGISGQVGHSGRSFGRGHALFRSFQVQVRNVPVRSSNVSVQPRDNTVDFIPQTTTSSLIPGAFRPRQGSTENSPASLHAEHLPLHNTIQNRIPRLPLS